MRPEGTSGGRFGRGLGPVLRPRAARRIALLGGLPFALRVVREAAPRGTITDRRGRAIVVGRPGHDLVARPGDLRGPRGTGVLSRLARALGVPVGELTAGVRSARGRSPRDGHGRRGGRPTASGVPVRARPRLPRHRAEADLGSHVPGGHSPRPCPRLHGADRRGGDRGVPARRVLGDERVGRAGPEARYEEHLAGTPGEALVGVDAEGQPVGRGGAATSRAPQPGGTRELSIDLTTQRALDPPQDEARRLGLGAPTGIDAPGEVDGLVPDPRWKERALAESPDPLDRTWKPGDSINLSTGQGDLLVAPVQMATAYAAIANGGTRVVPTTGRRIPDPAGQPLRRIVAGAKERPAGLGAETLAVLRDGLLGAANGIDGTSTAVFGAVPEEFWYVGHAPFDDPRIVVAVVNEQGGQGANAAAPAVCRTMAAALRFAAGRCGAGAEAN